MTLDLSTLSLDRLAELVFAGDLELESIDDAAARASISTMFAREQRRRHEAELLADLERSGAALVPVLDGIDDLDELVASVGVWVPEPVHGELSLEVPRDGEPPHAKTVDEVLAEVDELPRGQRTTAARVFLELEEAGDVARKTLVPELELRAGVGRPELTVIDGVLIATGITQDELDAAVADHRRAQ